MLNKILSGFLVVFLLLSTQQAHATATVLPQPIARFFTAAGAPLAGGLVYTYAAGTTTPMASYMDSTGLIQNSNPVILDSTGSASIWISGAYKIVLKDSTGVVQWTADNIQDLFTYDQITSTSTTSVAIANTASQTFTTQPGKYYSPGIYVQIVNTAAPTTNWEHAQVVSYIGTQLVVETDATAGSGTYGAWTISLSGPLGPAGPAGPTGSGAGDMVGSANLAVGAGGVADAAASRGNLGLGSAAVLNAGTGANQAVALDGSAHLPAVNASALTSLTAGNLTGTLPAIDGHLLTGLSTPSVTASATGKVVMGSLTIQWGSVGQPSGSTLGNFLSSFSGTPYSVSLANYPGETCTLLSLSSSQIQIVNAGNPGCYYTVIGPT